MTSKRLATLALPLLLAIPACTTDTAAPEAAPPPEAAAEPFARANPLPAEPNNWLEAPQTVGDWTYQSGARQTSSRFIAPGGRILFTMSCDWNSRTITLNRAGTTSSPALMRILTSDDSALLDARGGQAGGVSASLPATSRILAAMAFSRGRFAVEASEMPTLYLPSWAEVMRVIEDCN